MRKELKALLRELKLLKDDIKGCEVKEVKALIPHLGIGNPNPQQHLLDHVENIVKYLTPPTADELCKALQEYWGSNYKVNVSVSNQIFIESKTDKDGDSCIEWDGEKVYFDWMPCYPPHIITLIGRFYEGLEISKEILLLEGSI